MLKTSPAGVALVAGTGGTGCRDVPQVTWHSGGVDDAMTDVLEKRKAFDDVRAEAKAMVDRARAVLGLSMVQARKTGGESQTTIAAKMGIGPQQVRDYEKAYRDWLRDHPGKSLTD
jgi:hypothetical protein